MSAEQLALEVCFRQGDEEQGSVFYTPQFCAARAADFRFR
jgi:hypothetical protein